MSGKTTLRFAREANELTAHIVLDVDGDGQFVLVVRADGFSGHGLGFFTAEALAGFTRQMDDVARSLHGEARLESLDGSGIRMTITPITARGDYAVEGCVSTLAHGEKQRLQQVLTFIFEIELGDIAAAARALAKLVASRPGG